MLEKNISNPLTELKRAKTSIKIILMLKLSIKTKNNVKAITNINPI